MDQTLLYLAVYLAVLPHVTTDAYSGIVDDDDYYNNLRQFYDDSAMDAPSSEKRVAPTYPQDYWGRSETSRVNDNTLFNLFRRGGAWSNGGRWTGSQRITPYVTYGDGVNYKSNRNNYGLSSPSSWYGRGWYRVLARAKQPSYRSRNSYANIY
ncbi:uncharacterized protein LOC110464743 [Mizuhopecten yessoensis]|uniref:uncharacterized protein LOC110464743 n=1 Tax=Mizuhopecten yessoensis TaxID=6573 RepID=UPI000B458D8C|nr:uncharacterized protein LOC110464743 [Mizuhopecten yessoensis]